MLRLFSRSRCLPPVGLLLTLLAVCACGEDETIGVINRAQIHPSPDSAHVIQFDTLAIRQSAVSRKRVGMRPALPPPSIAPRDKIHPIVQAWLGLAGADTLRWPRPAEGDTMLIITFRDTLALPSLPALGSSAPQDSIRLQGIRVRRRAIIDSLRALREVQYTGWTTKLRLRPDEIEDHFDLIPAIIVHIPLDSTRIFQLAEHGEVVSIEPSVYHGVELPRSMVTSASDGDPVEMGRQCIASDPYYHLDAGDGFIALLDNGVTTLPVLDGRIISALDCVGNANEDCSGNDGQPSDAGKLHGTLSAAILAANDAAGEAYRGVTPGRLHSYRIYHDNGAPVPKAVERALLLVLLETLAPVVLVELQLPPGPSYTDVDDMVDFIASEVIVIATNGNNGANGSGSVNSPARAHKVIGVGAYQIDHAGCSGPCDCPIEQGQSLGPAQADDRIKPDLVAPTNTAVKLGPAEHPQRYPGTSGAAPYAAGAAALLRNWILLNRPSVEPGEVYAMLILSGQRPHPDIDNNHGAGGLRLPLQGWVLWGKQTIDPGMTLDIPLDLEAERLKTVNAALWWPEEVDASHHDINLHLLGRKRFLFGRKQHGSSAQATSVFERAQAVGNRLKGGRWLLRIESAAETDVGPRTVYWAAHVIPR